jgi:hypothetical protein
MENKFIVVFLDEEGNEKSRKEFKTYREISKQLNINYHLVRDIHLIGQGEITKKFYHKDLTTLLKKIKIINVEKTFDF